MKNSQKWNRILTGAAAVSLAIGTMAPMAFAASASTQYNTRTMNVGSGFTAVVSGLVAQDQGHATEFLPIYYLMQGLGKLGYTVNWNGGTRVLNITTPTGVTVSAPSAAVGTPGADQMVIQLNGTGVMLAPRVVAKDQASGVMTTFAPIYYLNQALKLAGFTNTYNGSSWTLSGQAASQTGSLSATMTVSNQTNGTGTVASPAVSLNDSAISLSTTLKDASGNPLPNTAVTFNVSNYGNLPTQAPIVENESGTVISNTPQSTADQYTVYTNASGVASISMTGPAGETFAYEVVATAPYAGPNNTAVSTQPAYVEFVASNTAGIAPYATVKQAYNAAIGTPVPITVTLPPNAAGKPQANVLLTLNAESGTVNGSGTFVVNPSAADQHVSFVTSSGAVQGRTIQVTTNSSGIAQAYIADPYGEEVQVSVQSGIPNGVDQPNPTYISFAQTGIPSQINNFSISSTNPNIGQFAYVSGQLEDASGNPVPSGQILVTSPNINGGNDFAYQSGTTTTTFPLISSTLSVGVPATSAYGDLVTGDSAGNFSFAVTNTRYNASAPDTYSIYPVSNGEVAGSPITTGIPSGDQSIQFGNSTTLAYLSLGTVVNVIQGNSNTTLTGLSAQVDNGATSAGLPSLSYTADNGSNGQISDIYVEPQNTAGHHGAMQSQPETYNLSVSNGGLVYSINGTQLTNPASAVTVNYTPGATSSTGSYTVNGQPISMLSSTSLGATGAASGANPEDFEIGVVNGNTGATTLTIQSGNISSTASLNFAGGTPDQIVNFSGSTTIAAGQSSTVSFQVEDYTGNPVPSVATTIQTDQSNSDPLWVTQVNGAAITSLVNMGTTGTPNNVQVATPIPLGMGSTSVQYNVSDPGVANWTMNSNQFTVYTNATGNVSLTLAAGGINYPVPANGTNAGSYTTAPTPLQPSSALFWTDTNGDPNVVPLFIGMGAPTGAQVGTTNVGTAANPDYVYSNFKVQGSVGWTSAGSSVGGQTFTNSNGGDISFVIPSSGTYTYNAPSATQVTLTGGGSGASITINAPSATVINQANLGTVILQDPAGFTNDAGYSIGTLEITQTTGLTITNNGTITEAFVNPSSTSSATYTFSGTAPTTTYKSATATGTVTGAILATTGVEALPPSVVSAVYTTGAGTTVSGTLLDPMGNPVANHSVTATISGVTSSAVTTSSTGTFTVTVPTTTNTAGSQTITITDTTASPTVTLSAPVTVS